MPFIPNSTDGTLIDAEQSEVDTEDFAFLLRAYQGYGVKSGGAVTANSPVDTAVDVAAGTIWAGWKAVDFSASLNLAVGAPANKRFSLIKVSATGTVSVQHGTASATPEFPTPTSSTDVILAAIYMDNAGAATISTGAIIDKRITLKRNTLLPAAQWAFGR